MQQPPSSFPESDFSYYVIRENGQRFGPAKLDTLNQWITEGRLRPETKLQNELSGEMLTASELVGLIWPSMHAAHGAPDWSHAPGSPYPRQGYGAPVLTHHPGQSEQTLAWVFAALSVAGCFFYGIGGVIFGIIGIVMANKAQSAGNPNTKAPKILSISMLILSVLYFLLMAGVFVWVLSMAPNQPS